MLRRTRFISIHNLVVAVLMLSSSKIANLPTASATRTTKLALLHPKKITKSWEPRFLARVERELRQSTECGFEVVDRIEEADHLLYLDSSMEHSTKELVIHKELLEWAKRLGKFVSALSFKDRPFGVLPGIYTSLETRNLDPQLHLSWPHLEPPNDYVEDVVKRPSDQTSCLFSFTGSSSHRIRRRLFSTYDSSVNAKWNVKEVKRWFDHTEDEKKDYVEDILDSRFILCPRGIACYSHRILETILLERVPVIIADDWVPFSFTEQDYYIQIAEKDVGDIASRLEHAIENYDFYLSNILQVKSKWLVPQNRYLKAVGHYLNLHRQNQTAHDPAALLDRVQSFDFLKSNRLLSHQRVFSTVGAIAGVGRKMLR